MKSLIKSNQDGSKEVVMMSGKSEACLKSILIYMFRQSKIIDRFTSINHEKTELLITTFFNNKIKYFIR